MAATKYWKSSVKCRINSVVVALVVVFVGTAFIFGDMDDAVVAVLVVIAVCPEF